ncbi:DUF1801 domain-containing protein [Rhodohalobacter sp. 614A]|uniref:DUF1801 domain-containing protein n=1 Tax=Rhodohalobacter sp. 614A TaxID=2908649 RepID=UPI001F19A574|nr:DUF1801 domain-containing protein [Rhodohalobacter sp. 614A]
MTPFQNPAVENKFSSYPEIIRPRLLKLRQMIFETASENETVNKLEETLSWGEPSYKTKTGSTVRMDWKKSQPDQYAMYFTCTTSLVDTFRKLYGDKLQFDGTRAIVFDLLKDIPELELKHCISLALTYHNVKHLPMLGV